MSMEAVSGFIVFWLLTGPAAAGAQVPQKSDGQVPVPFQPARKADVQAAHWPMRQIQGFHVVLLVGEMQPGATSAGDDLPAGARRALADMREFLPYKQYRVLDAQWNSCCSGGKSKVSGRLQGVIAIPGPNNSMQLVPRPYLFSITATDSGRAIETRFTLVSDDHGRAHSVDPSAVAEVERRLKNIEEDLATMAVRVRETQQRVEVGTASQIQLREMQDRYTQMKREAEAMQTQLERTDLPGGLPVMDSSFSMDAGETVVVGTSRLGGDKALIALVTAARRPSTERR